MKVIQKPFNNPKCKATITGIVEVILPPEIRARIVKIKQANSELTFSYIARYCMFRLLRQDNIFKKSRFKTLYGEDTGLSKSRRECKRLRTCFYGEDEKLIKMYSLENRVSMSKILRIALLWYLPELEKTETIPETPKVQNGYKMYARISIAKIKVFGTKVIKQFFTEKEMIGYRLEHLMFEPCHFSKNEFW